MIAIEYKCQCTEKVGVVYLKPRMDDEKVEALMDRIRAAVRDHHNEWFPLCTFIVAEWIKIPVQGKNTDNPIIGRNEK